MKWYRFQWMDHQLIGNCLNLLKKIEKKRNILLDIGSCCLHIIHRAFKSGVENNDWDIKSIFKAAYTILHDTPAWREDFYICNRMKKDFHYFFVQLAGWKIQFLEIWNSITKIARYWERLPKSREPSSKSFFKLQEAVSDNLFLQNFI